MKTTTLIRSVAAAALAAAFAPVPAQAAGAHAAESFARFSEAEDRFAFLERFCVECHNFEEWAGGVAFDVMDPAEIPEEAEIWETVLMKLRGGLMPPPAADHPSEDAIFEFVGWVEDYLDHSGALAPHPGHVPLHRLNRKEYANAVRDLLAMEVDPAILLPQDNVHEGFDNIAEVLQVSPSFLDQYLAAAHGIARRAIGNPQARPGSELYLPRPMENVKQTAHVPGLPLGTRGGMVVEHDFPADGEYVVNVNDMAHGVYFLGTEFEHTFILTLNGRKVYETTVGGEDDMRGIDQLQAPAVEEINRRFRDIRFHAPAGVHRVGATFVARSFAESESQRNSVAPGGGLERVPRVTSVEVRGPFNPTGLAETESRKAIFSCYPESATQEAACADEILSTLARRAYRRPVTEADMAELLASYESGHAAGGFEEGVRSGLTRILASPNFLYRAITPPEAAGPDEPFALNDLELASRLSFFLWSSIPDDELLSLAERGRLNNPRTLEAQVRRMLADPKSGSLARNFAYQWLELFKLEDVVPDPDLFPYAAEHRDLVGYNADVRADMEEEVLRFVDSVLRVDSNVAELLTADHTYLNERLALLYGINTVKGAAFRRVTLEHSPRWGLMGKGAVLTLTSYPDRTAPVLRGAYILENIWGAPPAAPPPNVEALPETPVGQQALTVRERMVVHRADPNCNSCHALMDPLGLALENFDAVGVWRDMDRFAGQPIDASGELPDGSPIAGPDDLREALVRRPEQFVQTFTQKLMMYGLGRPVEHHDMPAVRAIVREAEKQDYRFSSIVLGIVNSDQFLMSATPGEEEGRIEEAALRP